MPKPLPEYRGKSDSFHRDASRLAPSPAGVDCKLAGTNTPMRASPVLGSADSFARASPNWHSSRDDLSDPPERGAPTLWESRAVLRRRRRRAGFRCSTRLPRTSGHKASFHPVPCGCEPHADAAVQGHCETRGGNTRWVRPSLRFLESNSSPREMNPDAPTSDAEKVGAEVATKVLPRQAA